MSLHEESDHEGPASNSSREGEGVDSDDEGKIGNTKQQGFILMGGGGGRELVESLTTPTYLFFGSFHVDCAHTGRTEGVAN